MNSAATTIKAFNATRLDIPLRVPFGISGGVQPTANNVLVKIELADGTCGLGEAAPLPPYNGETQPATLAALTAAREWLMGADARNWRELGAMLRSRSVKSSGAAQCALESALLDAVARHDRVPLWKQFGGRGTTLETDMTITTGSAEEAGASAKAIRARGIRLIKVKIGGVATAAEDLARIVAVHAVAPDAPLVLDGNAGLTTAVAGELVAALKARGVVPALLEQWLPKDDLAGMAALARESGWPVAADESVTTREDALKVAEAGAAQVINIKLMKAGVAAALDVVEVARARGLELMIGGNVESILGMTMSACFAAGLGGFRYADLDTPWFMAANPFAGGFAVEGGTISVAGIAAGHGVTLAP